MSQIKLSALVLSIFAFLSANLFASPDMVHEPYVGSTAFEKLKQLEGKWVGESTSEGKTNPAEAIYEVSSAGTVVLEKLFPGTPHEMLTVYSENQGAVQMTHYCALKNQPVMKLEKSSDADFEFDFTPSPGINEAQDMHMHQLKIHMDGSDQITHAWTLYQAGQPAGTTTIQLKRTEA